MLLAIKQRQRLLLGFRTSESRLQMQLGKCTRWLTAAPQHHSYPCLQTPPSPTATDRVHQSGGESYAVQSVFSTTAEKEKEKAHFLYIQALCQSELFSSIDHWQHVLTA